ncbi:MAG: mitochondrial fission ELM1 family protein [Candidatus Omnitrophica bacterium]|nr:mitochondrial fission ELM1 family protein [Candidatus Omnitrophota bacterium]
MSSFRKSFLFAAVRTAAFIFMLLPMRTSLWLGRVLGWLGYYCLSQKRKVVYANLKTVFAGERSPRQLRILSREVFVNFIQSVVELLCLPKIKRLGFQKFVELEGSEHIDQGLSKGKGVIFLAIHSGSWELASIIGGVTNGSYHIVANEQPKLPQLDKMLNEYRTIAGARVITAGGAGKGIIKVLQDNGIVSLVLDQGGRTGLAVPFLGKTASMSTGAVRLALKYGCALCPVWIKRSAGGKHLLKVFPELSLVQTGDVEKDVEANVGAAVRIFEGLLKEHPEEYLWFYKVFKYSTQARVLIIDDGRTGHLRQSQALSGNLREVLKKRGKFAQENTVSLQWRNNWSSSWLTFYVYLSQYFSFLKREVCLKYFLTDHCFEELMKHKADFVISCGSQAAGTNFVLSRNHLARSICILSPGIISHERFDAVVLPEHDRPNDFRRARLIRPKISPNLVNAAYLKEQEEGLLRYYSHLKGNVRTKFGVLLGGDTDGVRFEEAQIRELLGGLKEAALHYNADILLTTSRRTPPAVEQAVVREFKSFERSCLCIIANQRNIPEAVGGILALSDLVIVSGESISMISESLSSGRSTIVFSPHGRWSDHPRDKYEDFVLQLNDQGYLMLSSVDDIKAKITLIMSRKISLKSVDDTKIIQSGLEAIV